MPTRKASAQWKGPLKEGKGVMRLGSGAFEGAYSAGSRFGEEQGTNPEELIGAAHAGCFSMALSLALGQDGYRPERIDTGARVTLSRQGEGFAITTIDLSCEAKVAEIDEDTFRQKAKAAKNDCPVSKALAGVDIRLDARLAP